MPIMNTLNNTVMGQIVNKAIMMGELERLLEKNFDEYTEEWKEKNLDIEINKAVAGNTYDKTKKEAKLNDEADIDEQPVINKKKKSSKYKTQADVIPKNKNYPLDRVLKIYGVDFFLRSQLKRRQFGYLTRLIESGKFLSNADLLLLKDMILNFKKEFNSDLETSELKEEIFGLERSITHGLFKSL